ncbi:MAG: FHA domain-containing protein [Solirubrobacterales bacterium]
MLFARDVWIRSFAGNSGCSASKRPLASPTGGVGKGVTIFTSVSPGTSVESFDVGAFPGSGTYFCASCGSQLSLRENDQLPECPRCGAVEYQRDSIFESMQDHGQTAELAMAIPDEPSDSEWLQTARAMLPKPGRYLAWHGDKGEIQIFPIKPGWTRIGRSAAADVRLDDPSVSRRHALIVSELPDTLRVLDDRSLNSVFLNGDPIEWARLGDGDELAIGRYRLFALES